MVFGFGCCSRDVKEILNVGSEVLWFGRVGLFGNFGGVSWVVFVDWGCVYEGYVGVEELVLWGFLFVVLW